ncbi:hypothetical protein [Gemmatimonas sp.]|uniref:hypothetical protein n=1 Tax=Gemmatimonas sp. TaxID=1962908 RepID=UPI00286C4CC1|nr:hypothetical protein [Gemmatimonas sp.]
MTHSSHPRAMDSDPTVLSEQTAAQVLARASELDQLRRAGSTVAELRVAATEAGIAVPDFDAALAEVQRQPSESPARPGDRTRRAIIQAAAVTLTVAAMAVVVSGTRKVQESVSTSSLRDEAIMVQCLAPAEAAELIRPLLTLSGNQVVVRANGTARVIALRVTAEQLAQVKTRLAPYEAASSPSCATPPAR